MHRIALPIVLLLLCGVAPAEGEKGKGPATSDPKYTNPELGVVFDGVYGWTVRRPEGSGAWTELVQYSESALDATVALLVRPNSYANVEEMRRAVAAEFAEGGEPAPGKAVYREITSKDVSMRAGNQLPGVEVEAVELSLSEEGKKRENQVLSRTYFGANRLYRIQCAVRRSRAKKVRDLLDRAMAGLTVTASDEQVSRGTVFQSVRGQWSCLVPDGFTAILGPSSWNADMMFEDPKTKTSVYVYSYAYPGSSRDHIEELQDHYRDGDFKVIEEEAKVLGSEGFKAMLTKSDRVTLITGAVLGGQVYRVHTVAVPSELENAKRVHEKFLENLHVGH